MSNIKVDTWQNQAGTREYYPCTAYVNFGGNGAVAIRSAGNVDSITDNGVGNYSINFTVNMVDIDYTTSVLAQRVASNNTYGNIATSSPKLVSSLTVITTNISFTAVDVDYVDVTIHGGI